MLAFRDKNLPKDVLGTIMEADLSTEQLEEVRKCIESGLNDQEIARVIENNPTAERMCKMREILLLMEGTEGRCLICLRLKMWYRHFPF